MNFRKIFFILIFFSFQSLFSAWFVESDLQFKVHFPRAWKKKVRRVEEALLIRMFNREGIEISAKVFVKPESDLDREIEHKLERMNHYVEDLKILLEKKYKKKSKKFNEMILMIIQYTKNGEDYFSITLFARFEQTFYSVSGIAPKDKFSKYKNIFLSTIKTLQLSGEEDEGRNDSFAYLNKEKMDFEKADSILSDPQFLGKLIVYNHKYNQSNLTINNEAGFKISKKGMKALGLPPALKALPALKVLSTNSTKNELTEEFDLTDSKYFDGK